MDEDTQAKIDVVKTAAEATTTATDEISANDVLQLRRFSIFARGDAAKSSE